jgi:N-acetylmuramoyl-L-alanine amidase
MKIYISPSQQPKNIYADGLFTEQEVMHALARYVYSYLDIFGYEVKTSLVQTMRDNINEGNAWGAGIYVALHSNAFNGIGDGTLVLYTSEEGKKLAQSIYNELAPITPSSDEGIRKEPGLAELKDTDMPAVIIEVAYHDNKEDMKFILLNLDRIALAIAKGIIKYGSD